jgi:hypothetical protein
MSKNTYTAEHFKSDLEELQNMMESKNGGAMNDQKRHFKLVQLNGKEVNFGTAEIKMGKSPNTAARKILKSIAHEKGLMGNNKLKLGSVTFIIQETTRGYKTHGKQYGPYVGKYQKYTAAEMKKAKASGREYHMKPVVTLKKHNKSNENKKNNKNVKNNMKGGK